MSRYEILIQPSAQKELIRLAHPIQSKILKTLSALAENPRLSGCKKLVGTDSWRIRVGDYRIVYWIEDNVLSIEIIRVAHRKEVYR